MHRMKYKNSDQSTLSEGRYNYFTKQVEVSSKLGKPKNKKSSKEEIKKRQRSGEEFKE